MINETKEIIINLTEILGYKVNPNHIEVEDLGIPHTPPTPTRLKDRSAVYMFFDKNGECLKVGKVGKHSAVRFCYSHYKEANAHRTSLVKSLIEDGTIEKGNKFETKNWVSENTRRINIYFSSDCPPFINGLVESAFIYKYKPKYEKNDGRWDKQ